MDIEYLTEIYNQLYDHIQSNKMDRITLFEVCYFMEHINKIINKYNDIISEIDNIKINYRLIRSKL